MVQLCVETIRHTCEREHLFDQVSRILVACSGGPDSMGLVYILQEIYPQCHIGVVTLDHQLRLESGEELALVERIAQKEDWDFYGQSVDIKSLAEKKGLSIEEMGRSMRYKIFQEIAALHEYDCIAVAHHKRDQAETILAHMIRGCGLNGLQGMKYRTDSVSGIPIIRPLLDVTKEELVEYVETHHIPYVIDASNFDTQYTRNRIRWDVLPPMETINPKAVDAILRLGHLAQQAYAYIDKRAQEALEACVLSSGQEKHDRHRNSTTTTDSNALSLHEKRARGQQHDAYQPETCSYISLSKTCMRQLDRAILPYVWRRAFTMIKMASIDGELVARRLEEVHEKQLCTLLDSKEVKVFTIGQMKVVAQYDKIVIGVASVVDEIFKSSVQQLVTIEQVCIQDTAPSLLHDNQFCIPYEWVTDGITIRHRAPGDRIILLNGQGQRIGSKKLKSYLIDRKIPTSKRDVLYFIAIGHQLVLPYRKNCALRVVDSTASAYYVGTIKETDYNVT